MNLSRKHKKLRYEKLIAANIGGKCRRQFLKWIQRNNLSIDEIRYLINDGWHLYGNSVKEQFIRSKSANNSVYGFTVSQLNGR